MDNRTETVTVDLVLTRDPNFEKQVPPGVALTTMGDVRIIHHPQTRPVATSSLDFKVRYEMTEVSDSVGVSVIAEGRNDTQSPIGTCGCFSFWRTSFALGPEQMQ